MSEQEVCELLGRKPLPGPTASDVDPTVPQIDLNVRYWVVDENTRIMLHFDDDQKVDYKDLVRGKLSIAKRQEGFGGWLKRVVGY
jgi:hypothetical protein